MDYNDDDFDTPNGDDGLEVARLEHEEHEALLQTQADQASQRSLEEEQAQQDQQREEQRRRDEERRADDIQRENDRKRDDQRREDFDRSQRDKEDSQRNSAVNEGKPQEGDPQDAVNDGVEDTRGTSPKGTTQMEEMKERAAQELADYRAKQTPVNAAEQGEGGESFYKGGFQDIHGNQRDARDVAAILENHERIGGHQGAQARFGLTSTSGSELAQAEYDKPAMDDRQPMAEERHEAIVREVERLNPEDQSVAVEVSNNEDWVAAMGMTDQQAEAVATQVRAEDVRERFLSQGGEKAPQVEDQHLYEGNQEQASTHAALTERLNDASTPEGQEALQSTVQEEDWGARMAEQEAQAEAKAKEAQQEEGFIRSR